MYCVSCLLTYCLLIVVVVDVVTQSSNISSIREQVASHTTNPTDARMQMFLERAEKSGIKLEALPESHA